MDWVDKRILRLNPKFKDSVNPKVLPWDGKQVTVESWHENYAMKDLFPDDELVGYVREFGLDVPESELKLR